MDPSRPLRVLLAYRSDVDGQGGAAVVMNETASALRELGIDVEISYDLEPDVARFDVVHAINAWSPDSALDQLRYLRRTGVPIVWQPFYLHWCEMAWAHLALPLALDPQRSESERAQLLQACADGSLLVHGLTRFAPHELVPGLHAQLREMLECIDHLVVCSTREVQMLAQTTGLTRIDWTLTRHGVDAAAFTDASPEPFRETFGVEDFVLCVGTVEMRKNQAMLVEALRGTGLTVVLLGPCVDLSYRQLVLARGGDAVHHIDRVPRELVASAYKAASVHALPSFAEGSALASMEAAAACCPVVVSNRSSEFEYYGDLAYYCDPADVGSIRAAVSAALERGADSTLGARLAEQMARYTWQDTARATVSAYTRAIESNRRGSRNRCGMADAREHAILALADELFDDPQLLTDYAQQHVALGGTTLVIYAPGLDGSALELRLVEIAGTAGLLDSEADLLALPVPADPAYEATLARAVSGVLSRRTPSGPFERLPYLNGAGVGDLVAAARSLP